MYASSHAYASNLYQNVAVDTGVASADAHGLISMLLAGAIERTGAARVALINKNPGMANEKVGATIAIVSELRGSLDHSVGGKLSADLDSLYDYIQRRLFEARREANQEVLLEVMDLLAQIYSGWLDIASARAE